MSFLDVNGVALAFDEAGDGELTPLVLIHGHPFDRTMWRPQLKAFAGSGRRLLAADLRGYGQSETTPGKVGLEVFASDLDALLTARGIEGPVVVCGLSMGGQIAMEVCRRFPERVAGLVLAATTPQAETDEGKRARNAMADRLLAEGLRPYANETLAKMLSAESIAALQEVADHVLSMMHRSGPAGAAAALRGRAERPDYQPTLAEFAAPALVVVGDRDAFTTRADAERMHGLLEGSELLWLEGVGHMPNLERAAEFNAALSRLLSVVDARAAKERTSHVAQ